MKPTNHEGVLVPVCPYCLVESVLHYTVYGRRWECPQRGCDARVGVHKHSPRAAPLGTLARAPLRELRRQVHEQFDPLWRGAHPRFASRSAAYAWLAKFMGIPEQRCHVGEFDERQCWRALGAIFDLQEVSR